jgi:membrane peptidoglycan carboxypeptidase
MPIAAVEPGTGRVRAMAINRHYSLDENPDGQENYPNTVNQLIAGSSTSSGYQAGSTFKMFTMLTALEAGMPLNTTITSKSPHRTNYPDGGPASCGGYYCPSNANPAWMDGSRNMWTGFGRSVNTFFVELIQRVGADKVVEMAQRLGIVFRAAGDAEMAKNASGWGSFTLGVASTTPLDLATAYATLAADGNYCAPLPVESITDPTGKPSNAANPVCKQVITADVARAGLDAARCPLGQQSAYGKCDGGTATYIASIMNGRPMSGKTGSSERNATETFVGVTVQLAAAGIAVNPDDPNDYVGADVASVVNRAVAQTIADALADEPVRQFTAPSQQIALGTA